MANEKYNPNVLALGFPEGCYSLNDEYMEGSKIRENKKQGENIEEMIDDAKNLLNGARGQ